MNCCLNEINTKLRDCLPESKQNNSILLDELISNYRKFLTINQLQNNLQPYLQNNLQSCPQKTKSTNDSYSSLTPLESLDDNEFENSS